MKHIHGFITIDKWTWEIIKNYIVCISYAVKNPNLLFVEKYKYVFAFVDKLFRVFYIVYVCILLCSWLLLIF